MTRTVLITVLVAACVGAALQLDVPRLLVDTLWPAKTSDTTSEAGLAGRDVTYTTWDAEQSPEYYRVVGPAVVDMALEVEEIRYAPLDRRGRSVRVAGCIDPDTVKAGIARERTDLKGVDPSGWGHNGWTDIALPDGSSYRGYLWNRSHLLAKSLGGSDEVENLVCATRTQNVGANDGAGGMAYGEGLVRSWLFAHPDGWVYYSAQPVYKGNELVCRSVIVDIRSSDGSLDTELEVYNAALGHRIDYATGEFSQL